MRSPEFQKEVDLPARARGHFKHLGIDELRRLSMGASTIKIGLIDGPVSIRQSISGDTLTRENSIDARPGIESCTNPHGIACLHGSFVANMLTSAHPDVPGICPGCTVLVYPIFTDTSSGAQPTASPHALAAAIHRCIDDKVRIISLSLSIIEISLLGSKVVNDALDRAYLGNTIVVAATGNECQVLSTTITRHKAVVPVIACTDSGRPLETSSLSITVASRGIMAFGRDVVGIDASGAILSLSGSSFAVPFITGALALLWSLFPAANAARIREALLLQPRKRISSLVPPPLRAAASFAALAR